MLQSTKRRLSTLERSIELPLTADRFFAQVQERVRLTGVSFHEAVRTLTESLSVEGLDAVIDETLFNAFKGNISAAHEWKRKVLEGIDSDNATQQAVRLRDSSLRN